MTSLTGLILTVQQSFQTQTPPSNIPDVWLVVELVGNFPWKTLFD